jgi:hypothetical protein
MAIINAKLFISKNSFRIVHGYLFCLCFCIDVGYENSADIEPLFKDTICLKLLTCVSKYSVRHFITALIYYISQHVMCQKISHYMAHI